MPRLWQLRPESVKARAAKNALPNLHNNLPNRFMLAEIIDGIRRCAIER